jgi:hypothetical protein
MVASLRGAVRDRIVALFREEDASEAERLVEECTDDPVITDGVRSQASDRVLFAIIRLSGGRLDGLRDAIALGRRDWRDLLCAAEFGEDVHAHERWQPRRLDADTAERWLSGDRPPGVELFANDTVELLVGPERGKKGKVIALLSLEPEPRYLVDLGDGQLLESYERILLRRAE